VTKGEETRRRIVERAALLSSRAGLDGLSIGELATDLGLSKSGLFAHFGSKEELQVAVLAAASERFTLQVVKPAQRAPAGEARMRVFFERWLAWAADPASPGGCLFLAAVVELDDREGKAREYLVGKQRQLIELLAKLVRGAIEQGELRKDVDCDTFAFTWFGLVFSFSHQRRLLRERKAEARALAAFEALLASARK
jgi:AcrR family transcriptional regulator